MKHESDEMFAKTEFVCEATGNEVQMFWEKFSTESMTKGEQNKYKWVQHNPGYVITVGKFGGMPVVISCFWYSIDGVLVMFYEPTSMVVHHGMIEKWLKENCSPRWDHGTRPAHTNSMNFHHVLNHVRDVTTGQYRVAERKDMLHKPPQEEKKAKKAIKVKGTKQA